MRQLLGRHEGSQAISAGSGDGIEGLLLAVGDRLRHLTEVTELRIPYSRGDALAAVHREGEVLSETHGDDGTVVHARLDDASRSLFAEFVARDSEYDAL